MTTDKLKQENKALKAKISELEGKLKTTTATAREQSAYASAYLGIINRIIEKKL